MEHRIMAENKVLTRDEAIPNNILPTGRKLGIFPVKSTGMFSIKYDDDKNGGSIPNRYNGKYTGLSQAKRDLIKFLNELWDVSDSSTKKKPSNDAISR